MSTPDLPKMEALLARVGTADPVFDAWRNAVPDKHWTKIDLSALRVGYELGKATAQPSRASEKLATALRALLPYAYSDGAPNTLMDAADQALAAHSAAPAQGGAA